VTIRMGLVGAGPWARTMHAPTFAAGPETTLAAVHARRLEAASALASHYGATPTTDFDVFLDLCDAVAFAVRPDVQASLAIRAAQAGKALLLEKPIALDLASAKELAAAVDAAGVVTQLDLTKRYHPTTRAFLASAASFPAIGARSCYLHGAFLGGALATDWRLQYGALHDLGPHLLDLLETALGPIAEIHATGDSTKWIELTCTHSSGTVSQASLSGSVGLPKARTTVELFGPSGSLAFDTATIDHSECWPIMRAEFAEAVRTGRSHPLDVHHGLRLQELIAMATTSLG
jgi:predicted dehydrogenase